MYSKKTNRRILVIDDNEAIHDDFRVILRENDDGEIVNVTEQEGVIFGASSKSQDREFEIDSALQGQDGIEKVRQSVEDGKPYAMAFIDIRMPPGLDGIETTKQIWKIDPRIQIVLCTAYSDYSWHDMIKELGETDQLLILKKPFDIIEVRQISCSITQKWNLLNRLNQLVGQRTSELADFAYIAAHDLKEPLRGIGTLVDCLLEEYGEKFDDDGKKKAQQITRRTKRMRDLIDGILRYSELGSDLREKENIDLNDIAKEAIDLLGPIENIDISIKNKLPVLLCEKTRILQVFQNLIYNAVKYMDKSHGKIEIDCAENEDYWEFRVADNGCGIDKKYFDKIFKIFQTLAKTSDEKGTGIGLCLVKKIVEIYNGKIWVQSEPGKGSTFFFTLPKQRKEVKNVQQQSNITC